MAAKKKAPALTETCPECGKGFATARALQGHIRMKHTGITPSVGRTVMEGLVSAVTSDQFKPLPELCATKWRDFHCVLVDKNHKVTGGQTQERYYRQMGYVPLSSDPDEIGYYDHILMGMPKDLHEARRRERLAKANRGREDISQGLKRLVPAHVMQPAPLSYDQAVGAAGSAAREYEQVPSMSQVNQMLNPED